MSDTKERILRTSLRLFAKRGYDAVSVSDIAGELGVTKGALYRHFKNKRDILDSIIKRMETRDAELARESGLPEKSRQEVPNDYVGQTVDAVVDFAAAEFRHWTTDEFAADFRRMLTLEQYCSSKMTGLFAQYLLCGPLKYTEDILYAAGISDAKSYAVELYAPMFMYYQLYDLAEDKNGVIEDADNFFKNVRDKLNRCPKSGQEKRLEQ